MPSLAVDTAFKARLTESWTATPFLGDGNLQDNLTEPPPGDAFLVVQYPITEGTKPVLSGKYFDDGAARLVLNVRRYVSQSQALMWADLLASIFREFRSVDVVGFETFIPSSPIINDAIDDGNFIEYSVIVPYRFQY